MIGHDRQVVLVHTGACTTTIIIIIMPSRLLYILLDCGIKSAYTAIMERKPPREGPLVSLPLKRSFFSVLAVSFAASSSIGYALGYPSSALIDLQQLPDGYRFESGSIEAQLFVVRNYRRTYALTVIITRIRFHYSRAVI